eukprot:UN29348
MKGVVSRESVRNSFKRRHGIAIDERHERFSVGDLIEYNNCKGRILHLYEDSADIAMTSIDDIFTIEVKIKDINTYVEVGDFIHCEFINGHWYEGQVIEKNKVIGLDLVVKPLGPYYIHTQTNTYYVGVKDMFVDIKRIRPLRCFNKDGIPLRSMAPVIIEHRRSVVLGSLNSLLGHVLPDSLTCIIANYEVKNWCSLREGEHH